MTENECFLTLIGFCLIILITILCYYGSIRTKSISTYKTLRVAAIFGAISICYICIMEIWGGFTVNQTTSYKYEAIHNKNIEKYPKCYAKGKFNVCESASGKKVIVDEYWKIEEKTNN